VIKIPWGEKWQGETLDWAWFEEEPPLDIYTEHVGRNSDAYSAILRATSLSTPHLSDDADNTNADS
jgi:phage terminase large subunit-like protein